jgi:glyoxylase-like metal-dependent hydrolase (beta-lactamase superfamily II)
VIVDPVAFSPDDLSVIEAAGLKPDALVITNRNHLRERESVLKRWKIPTVLHELEVESSCISPDKTVKNGDKLHGLVVVHLPGKSPGEIALYWPERRLFLLGDALIAPGGKLKTVPAEKQDDPALLKKSLELLRGYDFDHLLVGDGDPVLGDAKTAVVAFLKK